MPQSLSAVYIHLVFSTKHRQPFLRDQSLREDLHAFLGGISKTLECPPLLVGESKTTFTCLHVSEGRLRRPNG